MKKKLKVFLIILVPCLCAWLISTYLFQCMLIQGRSMEPAYHHLQFVVVDKRPTTYRQGDVVLLYSAGLDATIVKRIAAGPGESVIIKDQTLYVNDVPSGLYPAGSIAYGGLLSEEVRLGAEEYIVLGDNLAESKDSRYEEVGIIHTQDIIGKLM